MKQTTLIQRDFDNTFATMDQADYPATCDNCGAEGTNQTMWDHLCPKYDKLFHFPCSIGEHEDCPRRKARVRCPCMCHKKVDHQ